jgi:uncharacterized protein (UPF0332 family)
MRRQKGDYQYFVEFERSEVKNWLELAEKFVAEIRMLLETSNRQGQR